MAYPTRRYRPTKVDQQAAAALSLALAATPEAEAKVRAFNQRVRRVDVGLPTVAKPRAGGKRSTTEKGSEAERRARAVCAQEGYFCHKSHMSEGAADFIAIATSTGIEPGVRAVQVKSLTRFQASALNGAVKRFLGLDGKHRPLVIEARMEACLWVPQLQWAAWVCVERDGRVWGLTGGKAKEVVQSIEQSVYRARQRNGQLQRTRKRSAFSERTAE